MKKSLHTFILLSIFMSTFILLCALPLNVAAMSKSKARSIYKKYASRINEDISKGKLVDVDGNGIPEMFFYNSKDKVCVWTSTKKGKVKSLIKIGPYGRGGQVSYNKKKKRIYIITGDTGGGNYYFFKIKGTKATKVLTMKWSNGKYEKEAYWINKKKVDSDTFNNKLTDYMTGYKNVMNPYGN